MITDPDMGEAVGDEVKGVENARARATGLKGLFWGCFLGSLFGFFGLGRMGYDPPSYSLVTRSGVSVTRLVYRGRVYYNDSPQESSKWVDVDGAPVTRRNPFRPDGINLTEIHKDLLANERGRRLAGKR